MKKIYIAFFLFFILLSGCSKSDLPAKKGAAPTIVIGLIPEQNIFKQIERYRPLADYISKKADINIELKVLTRYGNIINNFISLNMDGAFFGSFTYSLAHSKLGVEVIARPEKIDGTSTYHGLIFVRKDSGIKKAKDMKGKRFALIDKATTAGYLLPMHYFRENGIKDYKTFLKEAYFAGTHENAILDVLNKKADIGAAKNTVFERLANNDPRIKNDLFVIKKSMDVPENAMAVRKNLDASIKNKLKKVLLEMHTDPEGRDILKNFGARRFIETTDSDYEPVYKYAEEIGLNLATYEYLNE